MSSSSSSSSPKLSSKKSKRRLDFSIDPDKDEEMVPGTPPAPEEKEEKFSSDDLKHEESPAKKVKENGYQSPVHVPDLDDNEPVGNVDAAMFGSSDPNASLKNHPLYFRNIDPEKDLEVQVSVFKDSDRCYVNIKKKGGDFKFAWLSPYARLNFPMLYPFGNYAFFYPEEKYATNNLDETRYKYSISDLAWNPATSKDGKDPEMQAYFDWLDKLELMAVRFIALNKVWPKNVDPAAEHRGRIEKMACDMKKAELASQIQLAGSILSAGGQLTDEQMEVMKVATKTMAFGKDKSKHVFPFTEFQLALANCEEASERKELYQKYKDFFSCKPDVDKSDLTDDELVQSTRLIFGHVVKTVLDKDTQEPRYRTMSVSRKVWSQMNAEDKKKLANNDYEFCEQLKHHKFLRLMAESQVGYKYNVLPLEDSTGSEVSFREAVKLPKNPVCLTWNTAVLYFESPQAEKIGIRVEPVRLRYYKSMSNEPGSADLVSKSLKPPVVAGCDEFPQMAGDDMLAKMNMSCGDDVVPMIKDKPRS